MKISKLLITTGLTSAIALGAFIESADAQVRRRRGNTYSPTSSNESSVIAQFTLVDTTEDGSPILDQETAARSGLFVGAIENYALVNGSVCSRFNSNAATEEVCSNRSNSSSVNADPDYFYDSSGFPIFLQSDPLSPLSPPINGNLSAQLFLPGEDLLFLNSKETVIAYSIINPETDEELFTVRLLPTGTVGSPGGYSGIDDFNFEEAVNSLSYILENNLLSRARPVEDGFLGIGSVLLQSRSEQISTTPVPESGTILGTLAALATGALIKRMKQH